VVTDRKIPKLEQVTRKNKREKVKYCSLMGYEWVQAATGVTWSRFQRLVLGLCALSLNAAVVLMNSEMSDELLYNIVSYQ